MLETITATIDLSSRLENPETTFTITLNGGGDATAAGSTVKTFDGRTKVPGGPSAMAVMKAYMFDLETEPSVLRVDQVPQPDGKIKVTINALIAAQEYEDREYSSSERKKFRVLEFADSTEDIAPGSSVTVKATPTDTNDLELEIVYDI